MNLTSLGLLATMVKRHYTMTSDCDRKMSLRNKHLSNSSNLSVTLLQFTSHLSTYPVKQTPVTIVIPTNIFSCPDRTCRYLKQTPNVQFRKVFTKFIAQI